MNTKTLLTSGFVVGFLTLPLSARLAYYVATMSPVDYGNCTVGWPPAILNVARGIIWFCWVFTPVMGVVHLLRLLKPERASQSFIIGMLHAGLSLMQMARGNFGPILWPTVFVAGLIPLFFLLWSWCVLFPGIKPERRDD